MNGNRLSRYDMMLHGLGLLVALGFISLAVSLIGSPMDRQRDQLQAQILDMEELLAENAGIEQVNEQLQAEVDRQSKQWHALLSRIPPEAQVSDYLATLTELAEENGLRVETFNPGLTRPQTFFEEMDIDVQALGDYASICGFLKGLNSMPRICNITKLDINAMGQSTDYYNVTLSLRILYNFDETSASNSTRPVK